MPARSSYDERNFRESCVGSGWVEKDEELFGDETFIKKFNVKVVKE